VDQGLSSASNFLLIVLVARTLDPTDFGTFAIAFGCLTLALGLSRANLGVPLSVDLPNLQDRTSIDLAIARSLGVGTTNGAVLGLVIACIAVAVAHDGGLRAALLVLALTSPFLVAQDVGRYVAVALGVPGRALVSDLVWVVVAVAVLGLGRLEGADKPVIVAGGWILGGLLGLLTIRNCLRRPRWSGSWLWFVNDRRRRHLTLDALTSAVAPLLMISIVATIVSPTVVAALRGASTLMSPINVAVAAVSLGAVTEITRRDWRAARRFVLLVSIGLAVSAGLWGLIVLALPDAVGRGLLGDTWPSAHTVLPFSTAEFVGVSIWNGAVALLRASGRTRTSARLRVVYLVLTVMTTTTAAASFGTARAVQVTLAVCAGLLATLTWVRAYPRPPDALP
jgi:hypothetical protein